MPTSNASIAPLRCTMVSASTCHVAARPRCPRSSAPMVRHLPVGPKRTEAPPNPGGTDATPAVVNLNTADLAGLEALPGVGPATAQAIVDYRQSHGRFDAVDDLLDVKGIGPAKFAAIKAHVTV